MPEKLTQAFVKQVSAPARGNKVHYDTEVRGFGLRITARGATSFILNYHVDGREKRMTIGQYPSWSVAAARDEAKTLRRLVDQGRDPLGTKQAERRAPTVEDLWRRYEAEHLPSLRERSRKDIRSMWTKDILPAFGKKKVAALTSTDVDALHRKITERASTRANRVAEVLRNALKLARRWGWIDRNPAEGFRRNPEDARATYLKPAEIQRLAECLNALDNQKAANAIRLMILTGARRGEVLNADWSQFDLGEGIWTKPSSHTKQAKTHRVPLSREAVTLLQDIKAVATTDLLFPTENGTTLSDVNRPWRKVRTEAGFPNLRIHDLRHSYASMLISDGVPLAVIGQLLGHTQAQTTLRYSHLADDPLRKATQTVGSTLSGN